VEGYISTGQSAFLARTRGQYKRTMARPKGSTSLASRLMAGRPDSAGIYELNAGGKQVYLHCWFRNKGNGQARLEVHYVGCGKTGRSQQVDERQKNPSHQAWLQQHWIGRTLLFAQPKRLERLAWLESVLQEHSCAEGLVIIETPFLKHAERVEARLIERYESEQAMFNRASGKLPAQQLRAVPNHGSLRTHVPEIRARLAAGDAVKAIARDFGVDPSSIRCIRNGRSYKNVA
jgi:hypothetical protein